MRDEDVARVSPLKHANLNCLGRYRFRASRHAIAAFGHLRARTPLTSTTWTTWTKTATRRTSTKPSVTAGKYAGVALCRVGVGQVVY